MRRLHIYFLLLLIVASTAFIACSNKHQTKEDIVTIDLIEATKTIKTLKLSELVDDVEYVKLETTEENIFGLARYLVTTSYIIVYEPYKATVFLFTRHGEFIRKFGRQGQGPGELNRISNIIVFPAEDYMIVHDGGYQKLVKFKITGEFIQEESFPRSEKYLISISLMGEDRFALLFTRPVIETENFSLIQIRNKNFNKVDSLYPVSTQLIENSFAPNGNSFYIKDDLIHFREHFFDTLYVYKGESFIPEYYFWIKENTQSHYAQKRGGSVYKYNQIWRQFELGDYLVCELETPGENEGEIFGYWILYQRESGDLFTLPELRWYIREKGVEPAIFNDIDGIHHIYMNDYTNTVITHFSEELIYKAIDIIDLKSYIDQKHHENIDVKLPQKQSELIDLIDQSSLNDNPILQIFHLK